MAVPQFVAGGPSGEVFAQFGAPNGGSDAASGVECDWATDSVSKKYRCKYPPEDTVRLSPMPGVGSASLKPRFTMQKTHTISLALPHFLPRWGGFQDAAGARVFM